MVIAAPSACAASIVHDFTDSPSTSTVHAPHDDVSQPTLVPVSPHASRRYCTSSVRASTSWSCAPPLTVIAICIGRDLVRTWRTSSRAVSGSAQLVDRDDRADQLAVGEAHDAVGVDHEHRARTPMIGRARRRTPSITFLSVSASSGNWKSFASWPTPRGCRRPGARCRAAPPATPSNFVEVVAVRAHLPRAARRVVARVEREHDLAAPVLRQRVVARTPFSTPGSVKSGAGCPTSIMRSSSTGYGSMSRQLIAGFEDTESGMSKFA